MATRVLAAWEECDKTDTVFILICTVICWTIVPTVSVATVLYCDSYQTNLTVIGGNRLWRVFMEAQRLGIRDARFAHNRYLFNSMVRHRVYLGLWRRRIGLW